MKKTGFIKSKRHGFTFVEILLALAILGVGLVTVLSLFVVGLNSVRDSLNVTNACLAVQMTLETFKQAGYSSLDGYGAGWSTMGDLTDRSGEAIYPELNRKISVTQNPVSFIPNCREVNLIIEDRITGKEIGRFVTYISKYEP